MHIENTEKQSRFFAHHPRTYPKELNRSLGPLVRSGALSLGMTALITPPTFAVNFGVSRLTDFDDVGAGGCGGFGALH